MRRREFIALMGASVTWPFATMAQEPGRTYRLGALWGGQRGVDDSINVSLRSAFLDPARRAGFIEGQNLTVDDRVYASPAYPFSEWADEQVKARSRCHRSCRGFANSGRTEGDEDNSDPWDYRRYARGRTSKLAGAARRQYDGRQHPRYRA